VGAKQLHLCAGLPAVEPNRLFARNRSSARQPEYIVNSTRPDQRIVGKIAFPAARMVDPELSHRGGRDRIGDQAAKDATQFKVPMLL